MFLHNNYYESIGEDFQSSRFLTEVTRLLTYLYNKFICAAGCSPAAGFAEQQETETTEQPDQQRTPETTAAQGKQLPQSNSTKVTLPAVCGKLRFGEQGVDSQSDTKHTSLFLLFRIVIMFKVMLMILFLESVLNKE